MGTIHLSRKAFFNNADYYSTLLGDKNKLCMALKDNAYGHGIEPMGQLCQEYGIKHTIVRTLDEAHRANPYGFETILILYEIPIKDYPSNYIFAINSIDDIHNYPANTNVELKIDTGMGRNGIMPCEIQEALQFIIERSLNLFGVFTHFCCADEQNGKTSQQEHLFAQCIEQIKQTLLEPFRIHCANSTGAHRIDNTKYDLGRIGIGMYGYIDLPQFEKNVTAVLSLYAKKISTRILTKGQSVGYGATFPINDESFTVSNYDIGYGDGFFRLNERKNALIKDGRKILGRISMDSLSVQGDDDEICIFDDATHLAHVHDTIHYEIVTHLSPTLKKVIT
ncbi:MAG: alanine racemase [Campylobacterota bacterium]|nr:alanine racemase [Campylobacterota bacterium]